MNNVTLIGRVGKEPYVFTSERGTRIAAFEIEVPDHLNRRPGENTVLRFRCKAFHRDAEKRPTLIKRVGRG